MHKEKNERMYLGFWIYLMTDILMFSVFFAVYAVLRGASAGGVTIDKVVNFPLVLNETLILISSSFVVGVAVLFARVFDKTKTVLLLLLTAVLGATFLGMELYEFSNLFSEGHTYVKSAFLSSFFSLIGFHGLHILTGVIWILLILFYISKKGLTDSMVRKITLLSIFWHFLDIVWIFIFTIVYLFGGIL